MLLNQKLNRSKSNVHGQIIEVENEILGNNTDGKLWTNGDNVVQLFKNKTIAQEIATEIMENSYDVDKCKVVQLKFKEVKNVCCNSIVSAWW